MMIKAASASAETARMPILSSDQASERVRGIVSFLLREKRVDVGIATGDVAQLVGVPFEPDPAVLQHDELGLVGLLPVGQDEVRPGRTAYGVVLRDIKGIAQLVRDEHR